MKIYILADMEGISGIWMQEQCVRDSTFFSHACQFLMDDINVAVNAAFEAGATEVVVCDTHYAGGQLQLDKMDARATYETPNTGLIMPSLDESFAGVVLIGHHARAGTINAFLDHTVSSASWFDYSINGLSVGEMGLEAAYAGHYNVPVIAVSGDAATAAEARELFGKVECAIVKWAIGRNRAKCLSLPNAHQQIHDAVYVAVKNASECKPFKPTLPAKIQIVLYRSDMADDFATHPGIERIDARTVSRTITSLLDVVKF